MNEAEKTVADEERKRKRKAYMAAYFTDYYARNKAKALARATKWNREHQELRNVKAFKYRAENKEQSTAWRLRNQESIKAYRDANRERSVAYMADYRIKNPQIIADCYHRRRARLTAGECHKDPTIAPWHKSWKCGRTAVRCYWCEGMFSPKLCHIDHVIALSKGGLHRIDNLCISCANCNHRKSAKDLSIWNTQITSPVLL